MTGTPRPKLIVLKCRCGCGQWAAFKTRPRFDDNGIPTSPGMYADTHREAVRNAIRWTEQERDVTEDDIRAAAVREAQAYIERISRKGLVPLSRVLADLAVVASRMELGMTARGSTRRAPVHQNGRDR